MSALPRAAAQSPDWRRPLRYLWRLPLLVVHVTIGLAITMLMINPLTARLRFRGERLDHLTIRLWSILMIRVFGMRVRRYGLPLPGAGLFVANHVSWIDITLLHSQRVLGFVAKAEISRWPLIGWLASRGGTIFHHRGNNESLHGVMHQMLGRLQAGAAVGVFPEGRTNDGRAIGAFHARIFQPAVMAEVPAQPVALKYGARGCAQTIVAFQPRENFLQNFWRLLGEPSRLVEVHFLEPVSVDADGRRRMAEICRERIAAAMAQ
ncbi:MAG: lysophospholipid acyltransferase family protein [Arenimonas sp.]|jgi:1-acyl-sn-glycerol-3-phosphate acyltransferase